MGHYEEQIEELGNLDNLDNSNVQLYNSVDNTFPNCFNDISDTDTGMFISNETHFHNDGKYTYKDGILHSIDGPAVEFVNGAKEWHYNGKLIMETDGEVTKDQLIEYKLRLL